MKIQGVTAPSQLGTGVWSHPAAPKGEAISPRGHRCCFIYTSNPFPTGHSTSVPGEPGLSRLLQEAELFQLHTQSSQQHFHSAQLVNLWLCLFFLNTDFISWINFTEQLLQGSRDLGTRRLTTARHCRLQQTLGKFSFPTSEQAPLTGLLLLHQNSSCLWELLI